MHKVSDLKNNYFGFYDGEDERNNVINLLKRNAEEHPNDIALKWVRTGWTTDWSDKIVENIPHDSITFAQFYGMICKTATGLKKSGIERGDCVLLFVPMSLHLYQIMSAIMMIGARAVFLDSWARRDQLGVGADVVKAKAMISFEQAFQFCAGVPEIEKIPIKIVVGPHKGEYSSTIEEYQQEEPTMKIQPVFGEETALITFTTGSSGVPKGADRTHEFLNAQHLALNECIPYTSEDIDLPAFPIFSLNNIAAGVNTVIPITNIGMPTPLDSVMLVSQMKDTRVTCATLSPSMVADVAAFCEKTGVKMENIRRVITGGAPVSNDVLTLFRKCVPNAKVWVLYGSTEAEPITHIEAEDILFPKFGSPDGEGVNVGHFAEGVEWKLIKIIKSPIEIKSKDDWKELEIKSGVGELIISGLHVCKSYYNNEEAVKKTKIKEEDGTVWHRTGDLAQVDEHGNVWLVGRVHNAISRDGELLFPVKVEILMKKHEDVKQSAFVGIPDEKLGEKAYALVELKDRANSDENKVIEEITEMLKENSIPFDHVGIVDHVPMDPRHHSKVEYEVLRKEILNK